MLKNLVKRLKAWWERRRLIRVYARMLRRLGFARGEARQEVKDAIEQFRQKRSDEGPLGLPEDLGDRIIEGAQEGREDCAEVAEKARQEGATEDDIRRWWNRSDLQRHMICWIEDAAVRVPMYKTAKEHGLSDEEAEEKVRQLFPVYGDPEDESSGAGDDRPLPHELRDRVQSYRKQQPGEELQRRLEDYSSFNALVRDEIRKGNI